MLGSGECPKGAEKLSYNDSHAMQNTSGSHSKVRSVTTFGVDVENAKVQSLISQRPIRPPGRVGSGEKRGTFRI